MFKNYLKILIRGLFKNKGYSVLNIFGLVIGIVCASLIFLWVENELDYNKSFPNKDYIYKILTNQEYNGEIYTFDATPGVLAPTLREEDPGIEYLTRFNNYEHLVSFGEKTFYKEGAYVDDDFYSIFSIKFIEGNVNNVKSDINGIVITQKTAKQYFGTDKNIVGKTLKIDNEKDCKITGVIADLPDNVSFRFDWLASFKAYEAGKEYLKYWGNNSTSTIIQLAKKADFNSVSSAVKKIIPKNTDNEGRIYGILYSINDWHLRSNFENGVQNGGRIVYVRLFTIIAIIILIIACINFMNLATARSIKRANEVGVRKVLGSKRIHLIVQFFIESFVLTSIAAIISVFFVLLLLPQFNQIIGKNLQIELANPIHIAVLAGIVIFCSILSGCYPAFYLSSFKPIVILKGLKGNQGGATFIRNGLVVVQFAASIIFIISTIVIYTQIKHVKNRNIGYNKSNLVSINIQGDLLKKIDVVKQEMLNTGMIEHIGLNSYNVLNGGNNGSGYSWDGKAEKFDPLISQRFIDPDFFSTIGIKIIDGHNFYKKTNENSIEAIITSSFAKMISSNGSAVGKLIRRNDDVYEIVGVINDIVYGNMSTEKSSPVIFFNYPSEASYIYARIKKNSSINKAITALSAVMQKNNPAFPFKYNFVEDTFNSKFKNEMLIEKLSQWFALLAILISCFGLFGLAAFTAEQKSKEITIRKVLGASIPNIVTLLSQEFLKLVSISILIAIPIAWLIMSNWLQKFAYRINISWWMYTLAALIAIFIAMFTISFQAIKAARTNPAKTLRTE